MPNYLITSQDAPAAKKNVSKKDLDFFTFYGELKGLLPSAIATINLTQNDQREQIEIILKSESSPYPKIQGYLIRELVEERKVYKNVRVTEEFLAELQRNKKMLVNERGGFREVKVGQEIPLQETILRPKSDPMIEAFFNFFSNENQESASQEYSNRGFRGFAGPSSKKSPGEQMKVYEWFRLWAITFSEQKNFLFSEFIGGFDNARLILNSLVEDHAEMLKIEPKIIALREEIEGLEKKRARILNFIAERKLEPFWATIKKILP